MADSKISALTDGSPLGVGDELAIARSGSSLRVFAPPRLGANELIYRYTVTGSDKASIDTGVDTADAGSNVWTNGDLLEVFLYLRTDESAAFSQVDLTLNNDTSSIYDSIELDNANTTVGGGPHIGVANWFFGVTGASALSNLFASWMLRIPNYGGTVGHKSGRIEGGFADSTAANARNDTWTLNYRSTSAVTRLKIVPDTAGKKFKVGSQLLIYKRLAS